MSKLLRRISLAATFMLISGIILVAVAVKAMGFRGYSSVGGAQNGDAFSMFKGEDSYELTAFDGIKELTVKIEQGNVRIVPGDRLTVSADKINKNLFSCEADDENLEVKYKNEKIAVVLNTDFEDFLNNISVEPESTVTPQTFTITVPSDSFENILIELGAGEIEIEGVNAEDIELRLGAGAHTISKVNAERFKCETGVGETTYRNVTVSAAEIKTGVGDTKFIDCRFRDSDFEFGIGNVEYEGYMTGVNDITLGIGSVEMSLYGKREDYKVDVEDVVGSADVDKSGLGELLGSADNVIEIEGCGNVKVDFKDVE